MKEDEVRKVQEIFDVEDAERIVFNDRGWFSRVYVVDGGKYVVKFRREKVATREEYEVETETLRVLGSLQTDVMLPKLVAVGNDFEYIAYEGVVGTGFYKVLSGLSLEQRQAVGVALGVFLRQLHGLELPKAKLFDLEWEINKMQESYLTVVEVLKERLEAGVMGRVDDFMMKQMPERIRELGLGKRFCHGDLGLWNMFYDEAERLGIIDFGNAGYYDESKDFWGLTDDEILSSALESYGSNEVLREKVEIRRKCILFSDLVFYTTKGKEDDIAGVVEKVKNTFAN